MTDSRDAAPTGASLTVVACGKEKGKGTAVQTCTFAQSAPTTLKSTPLQGPVKQSLSRMATRTASQSFNRQGLKTRPTQISPRHPRRHPVWNTPCNGLTLPNRQRGPQ